MEKLNRAELLVLAVAPCVPDFLRVKAANMVSKLLPAEDDVKGGIEHFDNKQLIGMINATPTSPAFRRIVEVELERRLKVSSEAVQKPDEQKMTAQVIHGSVAVKIEDVEKVLSTDRSIVQAVFPDAYVERGSEENGTALMPPYMIVINAASGAYRHILGVGTSEDFAYQDALFRIRKKSITGK